MVTSKCEAEIGLFLTATPKKKKKEKKKKKVKKIRKKKLQKKLNFLQRKAKRKI
jgi:hypothetical protein